jgi:four helix bundle protein
MSSTGLQRLQVWVKAKDFAIVIYRLAIPLLPAEEKWSLANQMRRSVQSISANIAEGHGRYYYQETIRFCYIARGSLEETISHIILASELGYLPTKITNDLINRGDEVARLINGYIEYLKRSRQGEDEPGASPAVHELTEKYDFSISDDKSIDLEP